MHPRSHYSHPRPWLGAVHQARLLCTPGPLHGLRPSCRASDYSFFLAGDLLVTALFKYLSCTMQFPHVVSHSVVFVHSHCCANIATVNFRAASSCTLQQPTCRPSCPQPLATTNVIPVGQATLRDVIHVFKKGINGAAGWLSG